LAGKASYNGSFSKWIRPVTEHPSEELQSHEHCLQTGEDVAIFDLLEVKLLDPKPLLHQQENWLMDVSIPLKKKGSLTLEDVSKLVDSPDKLWGTGTSTKNGINNVKHEIEIELLITPETLNWSSEYINDFLECKIYDLVNIVEQIERDSFKIKLF
jgi:hypothetical protein